MVPEGSPLFSILGSRLLPEINRRCTVAARTIAEMVEKGKRKLRAKAGVMAANWDAMKSTMKSHYRDLPFGPNTTRAYEAGIDAAEYRVPDIDKWGDNFEAGASR